MFYTCKEVVISIRGTSKECYAHFLPISANERVNEVVQHEDIRNRKQRMKNISENLKMREHRGEDSLRLPWMREHYILVKFNISECKIINFL